MRLTNPGRSLLLSCALAIAAFGCKDNGGGHPATDAGHDSGRDAGPQDAGMPVYLRLAHLGYGNGIGKIHLCSNDGAGNRQLITTDSLVTGMFTNPNTPIPIDYGAITRHVSIPPLLLTALNGKTIEVFREAEAGAAVTTVGTSKFATCTPTGTALATAVVGTDITLSEGVYTTVVFVGGLGAEFVGQCPAGMGSYVCGAPAIIAMTDQRTAPNPAKAHVRVFIADARTGATPGYCGGPLNTADVNRTYLFGSPAGSATPIDTVGTGLVPYSGASAAVPGYIDINSVGLVDAGADGGNQPVPTIFSLHLNDPVSLNDAGAGPGPYVPSPCGTSPGYPNEAIAPAGILPNQTIFNIYADAGVQGSPVATVRLALSPNQVSTVFVSPYLTQFGDFANSYAPCNPDPAVPSCQPVGTCTTPCIGPTGLSTCTVGTAGCFWIDSSVAVADDAP